MLGYQEDADASGRNEMEDMGNDVLGSSWVVSGFGDILSLGGGVDLRLAVCRDGWSSVQIRM